MSARRFFVEKIMYIVFALSNSASIKVNQLNNSLLSGDISYVFILIGPPSAGKTMLAKRLPSILPPMTLREVLETIKIIDVGELF